MKCFINKQDDDNILSSFEVLPGSGEKCGIRHLRAEQRDKVCNEVKKIGSVEQYRAEVAQKTMNSGDKKPSILYGSHVLHNAMSKVKQRKRYDSDPIKAIDAMKNSAYSNSIHDIGMNPFFVHIWTNEQIICYKKVDKSYGITMCMDSTGLKLQKIKRLNSEVEHSLFLYVIA